MSAYERAAQFSSFKALEGYEDMGGEEAREVGQMEPLTEYEMEVLNQKNILIADVLEDGHHCKNDQNDPFFLDIILHYEPGTAEHSFTTVILFFRDQSKSSFLE